MYSLFQVLLKSSDYATFALYAMSCLVLMVLALLLPIETKGRSMKVRNHQLSTGGDQSCEEQTHDSEGFDRWVVCNPLVQYLGRTNNERLTVSNLTSAKAHLV